MSTIFADCRPAEVPAQAAWWSRHIERLIKRRVRRAEREVARHLAWRSDADLQRLGLSQVQIARIRAEAEPGSPML